MLTLEERVTRLEADMEEQKRLRASQDYDLSVLEAHLRAQDGLLKSLAKTQSEHTKTLTEHTKTLTEHTARLERLENKVDRLEVKVDRLGSGVDRMLAMLDTLIARESPN